MKARFSEARQGGSDCERSEWEFLKTESAGRRSGSSGGQGGWVFGKGWSVYRKNGSAGAKIGELMLKFDRVKNAANYSVQTAPAATGPWEDEALLTTARIVIRGLTACETIWARACANGFAGAGEWSAPAPAMAL